MTEPRRIGESNMKIRDTTPQGSHLSPAMPGDNSQSMVMVRRGDAEIITDVIENERSHTADFWDAVDRLKAALKAKGVAIRG